MPRRRLCPKRSARLVRRISLGAEVGIRIEGRDRRPKFVSERVDDGDARGPGDDVCCGDDLPRTFDRHTTADIGGKSRAPFDDDADAGLDNV